MLIRVTEDVLDVSEATAAVESPKAGAINVFLGVVRNTNLGRDVAYLEYDAYPSMAEKVMSAIVEIKTGVERTEEIIRLVWDVEKRLKTVVAIGVGTRCDENGEDHVVEPILEKLGYKLERAKTNIGLGRISPLQQPAAAKETVNA